MESDIPRRSRVELRTEAEAAISAAMGEVEKLPADARLTDALVLLEQARNLVSDFEDERAER